MMRPVYYLEFDDRAGTERDLFATFRLHHSWAKRLRKGRVIFLCDTKTREVYGKAKVLEVHPGKIMPILTEFAIWSHLEPKESQNLFFPATEEARHRRFESMQKRYGPNRVTETSNITAIILKRVK